MAFVRVVVGILKNQNQILIAERPVGKPYSGYWEFPGGKIEENESSRDALQRELQEELGIDVLTAEPWFEHTHAYPDKTVHLDMWLVTAFSGEPQSKEKQTLRWVSLQDLNTLGIPILEGNLPIMERIKTELSKERIESHK